MDVHFEQDLPPELWLQIFVYLSFTDLLSVIVTSPQMYKIASNPTLWSNANISISKLQREGIIQLSKVPRFRLLKKLNLSDWNSDNWQELIHIFQWISSSNSKLEYLKLPSFQINGEDFLHRVSNEVLARAVSGLTTVDGLQSCSSGQIRSILTTSIRSKTLNCLNLEDINLTHIPSDVLGRAISRLKMANLWNTHLTSCQLEMIFITSLSSSTLADLTLGFIDMSLMPNDLLAQGVARLKKFHLHTFLRWDQANAILTGSLTSNTLEDIKFAFNLQGISSELLTQAVAKLKRINFKESKLNQEQSTAIVNACLNSATLNELNLEWENLSHIPSDTLSKAVSRLYRAGLCKTQLSPSQCTAIITACYSSSTLKHLRLNQINLSSLPSDLICRAILRLNSLNLQSTNLTNSQCIDILTAIPTTDTLEDINLSCIDLAKVPTDILAKTVGCLTRVNFNMTNLTDEQCTQILLSGLKSKKLKSLQLYNVDSLQRVTPGLVNCSKLKFAKF